MRISPERIALGGAAAFALLMPALLLTGRAPKQGAQVTHSAMPLDAPAWRPVRALYARSLFGAPAVEEAPPADAPALIGIAGRLGSDAVALVRIQDGSTRTLKVGESVDGWTLASLAIDAAFFTRGAERTRVALPIGPDQ